MWDTLFGPLDRKYCFYFYALTVLNFVMLLIVGGLIGVTLFNGRDVKPGHVEIGIGLLIVYFVNRLYFTMCIGSTKNISSL